MGKGVASAERPVHHSPHARTPLHNTEMGTDIRRATWGGGKPPLRISTPLSSAAVHALRSRHQAIMVGAGTVAADNPRLDKTPLEYRKPADTNSRRPPRAHRCKLSSVHPIRRGRRYTSHHGTGTTFPPGHGNRLYPKANPSPA